MPKLAYDRQSMLAYINANPFAKAYVDAALWSSVDEDNTPLDRYGVGDIDTDSLSLIVFECTSFLAQCHIYGLAWEPTAENDERAGGDFWLTRNRHGAGFWDGDWAKGDALSDLAHRHGTCDVIEFNGELTFQ